MPVVGVPPPFRGPTQGQATIEVEGRTVRECLDAVEARHPGFHELVVDERGVAQRFVTLFVNGDEIAREALDTPVAAGDRVEVLTSAAGG